MSHNKKIGVGKKRIYLRSKELYDAIYGTNDSFNEYKLEVDDRFSDITQDLTKKANISDTYTRTVIDGLISGVSGGYTDNDIDNLLLLKSDLTYVDTQLSLKPDITDFTGNIANIAYTNVANNFTESQTISKLDLTGTPDSTAKYTAMGIISNRSTFHLTNMGASGEFWFNLGNTHGNGNVVRISNDEFKISSDNLRLVGLQNVSINTDELSLSGYGMMGNRESMYITNQHNSGSIFFGVTGNHSASNIMRIAANGMHLSLGEFHIDTVNPTIEFNDTNSDTQYRIRNNNGTFIIIDDNTSVLPYITRNGKTTIGNGSTSNLPISTLEVTDNSITNNNTVGLKIKQSHADGDSMLHFETPTRKYVFGIDASSGNEKLKISDGVTLGTNDLFTLSNLDGFAFLRGGQIIQGNTTQTGIIVNQTSTGDSIVGFKNPNQDFTIGIDATNNDFVLSASDTLGTTNLLNINNTNGVTVNHNVTATNFIRNGGTNSQFLKGDGSVDSTEYQPLDHYINMNIQNHDTYRLNSPYTFRVATATVLGDKPQNYVTIHNLGGDGVAQRGTQIASSYSNAHGFWIRRGSDSVSSPNGVGFQPWRKLITEFELPNLSNIAYKDENNLFSVAQTITGLLNTTIPTDSLMLSGYGIMGNRSAMYFTNRNSTGFMRFGFGGNHGSSMPNRFVIGTTDSEFRTNLSIDGNLVTQGTHNIQSGGSTPDNTQASYYDGLFITGGNQRLIIDVSDQTNGGSYIQTRHSSGANAHVFYNLALNPLGGNVTVGNPTFSTGKLNVQGRIQADIIAIEGGLNTQYLMADGSVSTSIGGAFLPLTGGELTGDLTINTTTINETRTLRFLENSELQGGFIKFDGASTNRFILGTHDATGTDVSDDIPHITMHRSGRLQLTNDIKVSNEIGNSDSVLRFTEGLNNQGMFLKYYGASDNRFEIGAHIVNDNNDSNDIAVISIDRATRRLTLNNDVVVRQTGSTGNTDSIMRFVEGTNSTGGFIHYDGSSTNDFIIGVHDTDDTVIANDINAITIARGNGAVTLIDTLNVGSSVTANQFIQNGGASDEFLMANGTVITTEDVVISDYLSTRSIANADTGANAGVMFHYLNNSAINRPSGVTDMSLMSLSHSANWVTQFGMDWRTNNSYTRTRNSGVWGSWAKILTDANFVAGTDYLIPDVNLAYKNIDNSFTTLQTVTNGILANGTGSNVAVNNDEVRYSGYGFIGNRTAMYITNQNATGIVSFGIGGQHADSQIAYIHSGGFRVSDGRLSVQTSHPRIDLNDTDANTNNWTILNNNGSFNLYDQTEATSRFTIDSTGRIGINKSSSIGAKLHIYENTTGTTSGTGVLIEQAGSGDAIQHFRVAGTEYTMGIDNSDFSKFKIANSTQLGTSDIFTLTENGDLTIPKTFTGATIVKQGGTSSEFLMADGSVTDGLSGYLNNYLPLTGGTMTGNIHIGTPVNTGSAQLRLSEINYQGGYIRYNAVSNMMQLGVHNANDTDDANDTDALVISRTTANISIGKAAPSSRLHIYENTNHVDGQGGLTIEQDGAGDAMLQFLLTGTRRWVLGVDNSDADKFKLASTQDLNNGVFEIDISGNVRATSFGVGGGTSNQFMKANGTLDNTSYLPLTGGTLTGELRVTGAGSDQVIIGATDSITHYIRYTENTTYRGMFISYDAGLNILNIGGHNVDSSDTANDTNFFSMSRSNGASTFTNTVTASSFIRQGGTSSQYLMADGSVSTGGVGGSFLPLDGSSPMVGDVWFQRGATDNQFIRFTEGATFQGGYIHYDGTNDSFNLGVHNLANTSTGSDINALRIDRVTGNMVVSTQISSPSFVRTGGLSTQYLMADGSVSTLSGDFNDYLPLVGGTITGDITYQGNGSSNDFFRFTEGATLQGGYLKYNGSGNQLILGVHEFANTNTASDVDALIIDRSTANITIPQTLTVGTIIRQGGTSSQYLMADGSVSTGTGGSFVPLDGSSSMTGDLIVSTTANSGDSMIRLTEGNLWQGGFMKYDASTNVFGIGVHSPNDNLTASDNAVLEFANTGAITISTTVSSSSNITANSFTKIGGTSTQYLMADGTVSTLAGDFSDYLPLAGGTMTGNLRIHNTSINPTIRLTENNLAGAYMYYDTQTNNFHLGTHVLTDNDPANDNDAMVINADNGAIELTGELTINNPVTADVGITANHFKLVTGGSPNHFLKSDGSVDSNQYLPTTGGIITGGTRIHSTSQHLKLRFTESTVTGGWIGYHPQDNKLRFGTNQTTSTESADVTSFEIDRGTARVTFFERTFIDDQLHVTSNTGSAQLVFDGGNTSNSPYIESNINGIELRANGTDAHIKLMPNSKWVGINEVSPTSVLHIVENNSSIGTNAGIKVEQQGAGDSVIHFSAGGQVFTMGIDNSDADNRFKISNGWQLGTNDLFMMDNIGIIQLGGKLDAYYNKTEVNFFLGQKANSTDVYLKTETYTKTEVDNALNLKANSADVYTQTQTDNLLDTKLDSDVVQVLTANTTVVQAMHNKTFMYHGATNIDIFVDDLLFDTRITFIKMGTGDIRFVNTGLEVINEATSTTEITTQYDSKQLVVHDGKKVLI